jgi:hypothetical protein
VPDLSARLARRRSDKLRRLAIRYVENGWPVARLAIPRGGSCACGLLGCLEPHLTLKTPPLISTRAEAESAFADGRWAIALATHTFDVLEVPAQFGAPLHYQLKGVCPTAFVPATRTWQFFMAGGSVPAELAVAAGGRLVKGPAGWVPAPGTNAEATGTIRWLVHPYLTKWHAYRRRDAIDMVFSTVDWSASEAPTSSSQRGIDDLLG